MTELGRRLLRYIFACGVAPGIAVAKRLSARMRVRRAEA